MRIFVLMSVKKRLKTNSFYKGACMKHQIVIVGGGAAGITVSALLGRKDKTLDIATGQDSGFCGPKIRYQCIEL